jgi:hypothetical protein
LDRGEPSGDVIDIFGLLAFGIDFRYQISGFIIHIRRFFAHGPDFFEQAAVLSICEQKGG